MTMLAASPEPVDRTSSPIAWQPLATAPDDRKDGRDVLLWVEDHGVLSSWDDGWRDPVGREVVGATHLADIQGPEVL
jgi:hypothetical protein